VWINPNTGKGWTDSEEAAFARIQQQSRLSRIQAIQLYKRVKSDADKALAIAKSNYPPLTDTQLAVLRKATSASVAARNRVSRDGNRPR